MRVLVIVVKGLLLRKLLHMSKNKCLHEKYSVIKDLEMRFLKKQKIRGISNHQG